MGKGMIKNINILGINYKINYISNDCRTDAFMGRADSKMAELNINIDMPIDQQESTIIHEIVHCISDMLILKLKEDQVNNLAIGLYPVVKQLHGKFNKGNSNE